MILFDRSIKKVQSFEEWLEMKAKEQHRLTKQRKTSYQLLEAQRFEAAMRKKEKAEKAFNDWLKSKQIRMTSA